MTIAEVKKGLLDQMKTVFPEQKYTYYSQAVVEGFRRPSFFTQIKLVDADLLNYNSRLIRAALYIDYMQESTDEADSLDVIQKIKEVFGLAVRIGDRAVHVTGIDWDFIGAERNILEISVDIEWGERIEHGTKETLPIMESAEFNTRMEEPDNGNA